jgi:putative membrane protein insertion efficiency factor
LLLLIDAYRVALAPLLGGHCRFWPSCSAYAEEAIQRHGARRGAALAVRRLLRCHPFTAGGLDPVPWSLDEKAPGVSRAGSEKSRAAVVRNC